MSLFPKKVEYPFKATGRCRMGDQRKTFELWDRSEQPHSRPVAGCKMSIFQKTEYPFNQW